MEVKKSASRQEIHFLESFDHPNIVRLYGWQQNLSETHLYLEYMSGTPLPNSIIQGGSVAQKLKQYGRLTESLTKKFIFQVLLGLIYLHDLKIVHKDIRG